MDAEPRNDGPDEPEEAPLTATLRPKGLLLPAEASGFGCLIPPGQIDPILYM